MGFIMHLPENVVKKNRQLAENNGLLLSNDKHRLFPFNDPVILYAWKKSFECQSTHGWCVVFKKELRTVR
jgi:hypothetical protein